MLLKGAPEKRIAAGKSLTCLALALAVSLGHVACGAGDRVVGIAAVRRPNEMSNRRVEGMKIRMEVEGAEVTATLDDNAAAVLQQLLLSYNPLSSSVITLREASS